MRRPNILLITIDCLRYDYFTRQLTAENSRTPFLKKLAKNAFVFNNFYANGSWSGTAMASIFTSTYPFDNQGKCTLYGREPTLPQFLQQAGYFTFGIHANPYFTAPFGYGRGFDYFYDWLSSSNKDICQIKTNFRDKLRRLIGTNTLTVKYLDKFFNKTIRPFLKKIYPTIAFTNPKAEKMNEIAFRCLNYYKRDFVKKPFFLWLHYMDLHEPLFPEVSYLRRKISKREIRRLFNKVVTHENINLSKKEFTMLKELYLASFSQIDAQINKLYQFVREALGCQQTIFIITADHGELLGEKKNFYSHGIWLYQEIVHIPLLITGFVDKGGRTIGSALLTHKDNKSSRRVSVWKGFLVNSNKKSCPKLISQLDLAPTIAKLAGIEPSPHWQGKAFLNERLEIEKGVQEIVFAQEGSIKKDDHIKPAGLGFESVLDWQKRSFALINGRYKYIKNFAFGKEELIDLINDPEERNSLINQDGHKKIFEKMRALLNEHVKRFIIFAAIAFFLIDL